ncbi:MAG: cytochrome c [Bacteroidetes bacterium]|nr:cytochrome c [Bacteroidota bacterium]
MISFRYKLFLLVTLSAAFLSYSALLYFADSKETQPANALAQKGKMLWQQKNCTACHQLYGLGGHLGPDLTNVYATRTEEHITTYLKYGSPVMPDYNLSAEEQTALLEFLKYVNTTGVAHPASFLKHTNGTISQP